MAIGRPTRYKKEFCEQLINHMAQGLSFDTFAGVVGVSRDSLYEWAKKFKEFSDAKGIATAKRNLLVERIFTSMAMGLEVRNHKGEIIKPRETPVIYWTKNTLGWSDKVEHAGDEAKPITLNYKIGE